MKNKELWDRVAKASLEQAAAILEKETAPTEREIEAVGKYIAIAEKSEGVNLHWAAQNRYAAAVFPNQPSSQR